MSSNRFLAFKDAELQTLRTGLAMRRIATRSRVPAAERVTVLGLLREAERELDNRGLKFSGARTEAVEVERAMDEAMKDLRAGFSKGLARALEQARRDEMGGA